MDLEDMDANAHDLYRSRKVVLYNQGRRRLNNIGHDVEEYKVAAVDDKGNVQRDTIMTVRVFINNDGGTGASLIRKGQDIVKLHTDHNHTNRRGEQPIGCPHKHYRKNGQCKKAYYVEEEFELHNVASIVDLFLRECNIERKFEIQGYMPI